MLWTAPISTISGPVNEERLRAKAVERLRLASHHSRKLNGCAIICLQGCCCGVGARAGANRNRGIGELQQSWGAAAFVSAGDLRAGPSTRNGAHRETVRAIGPHAGADAGGPADDRLLPPSPA